MNVGPLARRDGLVVKTVGDEVLVYDLERARAHSLDALAAAIWRQCDGRRPVAALAAAVRAETGVPVTAAAVEYGLAALDRARLLAGARPVPGPTRRQVLARIGTAAAIPLVLSITAPTAAQAQSRSQVCAGRGNGCGDSFPGSVCCPGLSCFLLAQPLVPCPGPGICFCGIGINP
jgi:Coenzyme PQQ synthesis protein D (PqqD)